MAEKPLAYISPRILDDGLDSDIRSQSSEDRHVMEQMGKLQQLKRRFNVFSIFGLSITLLSSWEALGMSLGISMTAGGSLSLVYSLLFTFMGSLACAASIAEMASICPISGAQMHWSYMFAPKEWKVAVSFIQGRWFRMHTRRILLMPTRMGHHICLASHGRVYVLPDSRSIARDRETQQPGLCHRAVAHDADNVGRRLSCVSPAHLGNQPASIT